ncbi:L10-interacting MYB domain-containing protein-like [Tasmannia lanceolata]|uniref:L10-interacting MYB domain-containing protein-like n=1 Tax=Tasmannia lanceolata TaxID=3420 RepID=UPI0040628888
MDSQIQKPFENQKMIPPPTRYFKSREALLEHVRSFSKTQGYIVTIAKSKKNYNVILGCDRGGKYRKRLETFDSQRATCSRVIGCPFEIEGRRMTDGSWILMVNNGEHNHEASKDISAHPYSRRFSGEDVLRIKEMINAGVQPRQIITALRNDNPDLLATPRDVYNLKAKIRKVYLSGHSEMMVRNESNIAKDAKEDAHEAESANWSLRDTGIFINLMVEEVEKGNRCARTFSKKAWKDIQTKFYQKTGCNYTLLQFRNKFRNLKKEYMEFKKLLEVTGFTWHPMTKTVTAEDSVWEAYIQANPYATKFRTTGCSHWVELQLIYGDTTGTGEIALGDAKDQLEFEEEDQIVDLGAHIDDMNVLATQSDDGEDPGIYRRDRTPTTLCMGNRSSAFNEAYKVLMEAPRASSSTSPSSIVETDPNSISKCMEILNAMEVVGPDEYVKGVRMFQDSGWREAFMMTPPDKRIWLLQRLS